VIGDEIAIRTHVSLADEDHSDIESQLEAEELFVSLELNKVNADIDNLDKALREKYLKSVEELEALESEIRELVAKKNDERSGANAEELLRQKKALEAEAINANAEHNKQMENRVKKNKIKVDKEAKALYKKIAAKTHPDKTNNKLFHQYFLKAKELYENNDILGLKELWSIVSGASKKTWIDAIINRLKELKDRINSKRLELTALKLSDKYHMSVDYADPNKAKHVERHYEMMLAARKHNLRNAIRQLDPTRYPQQTQYRILSTTTVNILGL
jgi:hypothetical protein